MQTRSTHRHAAPVLPAHASGQLHRGPDTPPSPAPQSPAQDMPFVAPPHEPAADHESLAAELANIRSILLMGLEQLLDTDRSFDVDNLYTGVFAANGFFDQELNGYLPGIAVFNFDSANDLYIGLAAGAGTLARRVFTLSARGFIVLPVLTSHVSVGGPGTGPALIVGLKHAPTINAGRF